MRLETFMRKSLGRKAHTVVKTEELPDGGLVAHVDRLPGRRRCCGKCGRPASRVAPFKKLAKTIRTHRDGILAWTKLRVTNGALEGMNHKGKAISHRGFGLRTTWTYSANIYHCCAAPPLP
jgi:hypothetical protein